MYPFFRLMPAGRGGIPTAVATVEDTRTLGPGQLRVSGPPRHPIRQIAFLVGSLGAVAPIPRPPGARMLLGDRNPRNGQGG